MLGREGDSVGVGHRLPPEQVGDTEVAEFDPTVVVEQHVARLDVSVDDPELVGSSQRVRHGNAQARNFVGSEPPVSSYDLAQRTAIEIFRDEIVLTGRHASRRVDGHDVGMGREAGDRLCFAAKASPRPIVLDIVAQNLERDLTIERLLASEVDDRGSAVTEHAQDGVAVEHGAGKHANRRAGPAPGTESSTCGQSDATTHAPCVRGDVGCSPHGR